MRLDSLPLWLALALAVLAGGALLVACTQQSKAPPAPAPAPAAGDAPAKGPAAKTDADWGTCLTAEQFKVLRQKGTERAFTGKYYDHHEAGVYVCAACRTPLFDSVAKFDSGTGWPSFTAPVSATSVATHDDTAHGMRRVEVVCAGCGGHLGHVFEDGPAPTGLRYCMNSVSLDFTPRK